MSESEDDSFGQREVAYRLFAAEFEDANLSYSEGEDDRSPNYVITPTGARVNRLFAVGVLTEVEQVSDDVLRGRIVDPTGAFVTYAGQYQPDVQAFLERVETPTFVAMTGKARTFQPEDSDQVFTSVRPESINEVDAETRDRWTVQAAEHTLDRIGYVATALTLERSGDALEQVFLEQGVDEGSATGIPIALDHYGTTPTYLEALRELALDAARVVAGERDEVGELRTEPDEAGSVSAEALADSNVSVGIQDSSSDEGPDIESEPAEETAVETVSSEPDETAQATPTETEASTAPSPTDSVEDQSATGDVDLDEDEPETTVQVQTDTAPVTDSEETSDGDPVADSTEDLGDFDPGEFELEAETREQVEEEFGTEFQTGTEVDEPGEADIQTPDEVTEEQSGVAEGNSETDAKSEAADAPESTIEEPDEESSVEEDSETEETGEAESVQTDQPDDLQAAVVDLMTELDEGDGASKEGIIAEMAERYGVDESGTEDAIQEALMDGECYEPADGQLKPI